MSMRRSRRSLAHNIPHFLAAIRSCKGLTHVVGVMVGIELSRTGVGMPQPPTDQVYWYAALSHPRAAGVTERVRMQIGSSRAERT